MRVGRTAISMTALVWVGTVAACSALPAGSSTPLITPAATPAGTSSQASLATPTLEPTPAATAASAGPTPSSANPSLAVKGPPPPGNLATDGVPPVAGQQGSWCYGGRCVDVGGAPKQSLPTVTLPSSGATLTFSMPSDAPFVHWSAWCAASLQDPPIVLGQGGSIYDVDAPPATPFEELTGATFAAPAGGDWALVVELGFDGDAGGDASYYWRVVVP